MAKITHYDYEFVTPDNWFDGSTVTMLGPHDGGYCPNITVTRNYIDSPMTCEEYSRKAREVMEAQLADAGYEVVLEHEFMLPCGLPAAARIQRFYVEQIDMRISQWQVFVIKEHDAVTLTCSDKVESFTANKPIFEQAVNSFKMLA